MSRKTNYQSGTSRSEHRLPSVFDGKKKKQQKKRDTVKQRKQVMFEQMSGLPLSNIAEYNMEYAVPPTPGWEFMPKSLPLDDPDRFIGNGEFVEFPNYSDPMDIDEPYDPPTDHTQFRYFNHQPTVPQFSHPLNVKKDPIDAFIDPYIEPEYFFEGIF